MCGQSDELVNSHGVVRMIYKDYLDGMTPGDIKKKLERMHIKTAFGRDTWSTTVILALLQNGCVKIGQNQEHPNSKGAPV